MANCFVISKSLVTTRLLCSSCKATRSRMPSTSSSNRYGVKINYTTWLERSSYINIQMRVLTNVRTVSHNSENGWPVQHNHKASKGVVLRTMRENNFKTFRNRARLFPADSVLNCVGPRIGVASRSYCTRDKNSGSDSNERQDSPEDKYTLNQKVHHTRAKYLETKAKIHEHREKVKGKVEETVKEIKENILTVPNVLTSIRIVLAPVIGYLVLEESYGIAVTLFGIAGITDLLDGYIARNFKGQTSALGSYLDPLADKLLVSILTITLTVMNLIPVPLTALILARDASLIAGGFYVRYVSLPPPRTIARYFDVRHATAQLQPTLISKVNTTVQLSLVVFTLTAPVLGYIDHPYLQALWYCTAATTVLSGLSYMVQKDTFRILSQQQRQNK
ncbi:PREDICTED: probable cardiolipin synthase (CMP-forming) [Priapulus caudatus]|uniref:cardiolipin synthase (CMP-forming) n=1 Tax=Priapulus caudatus TaxID=37621 RepID=A0ABM1E3V7_PRICU|nr:PREDICTED: probable cardiolipin synthase (CMP-forming) [Priapulus caudatus]